MKGINLPEANGGPLADPLWQREARNAPTFQFVVRSIANIYSTICYGIISNCELQLENS